MTAVAVRAWTQPEAGWPARRARPRKGRPSRYLLVFDTETADPDQRFLLLVWRLYYDGDCIVEGIAHADGLRSKRLAMLRDYVEHHQADTEPWARRRLVLVPLSTWIDKHLHRYGYANRAAVVGFNLPFDIGTIAGGDWTASRSGGFTFRLAPATPPPPAGSSGCGTGPTCRYSTSTTGRSSSGRAASRASVITPTAGAGARGSR